MKMNVNLINPVLKSMQDLFKTMIQIEANPEKPALKADHFGRGQYTGIITLTGRRVNISIAISFPEETIKAITQRMLPPDTIPTLGIMADLTGELANMIAGGAKSLYEANGYELQISLPILVIGQDHIIAHKTTGLKLLIPYDSQIGKFWVETCFQE